MAFKYRGGDREVEGVVKRSKQAGGSYDSYLSPDVQFLKVREGDGTVRILPPTWEDIKKYGDGWELQIFLHRNVGPDNGTYLCLDKMLGKTCPVCEARREATDEDEADLLKPQWRALAWVINRDDEKAGPQVMSIPITLFRDINSRSVDKKTNEVILIDHPDEGYDVLFNREGTDKRTKYSQVEIDRDPSPIHESEKKQEQWLAYIEDHPLPDILVYYEPEYIEKVLFGRSERRGRDDEEERPRSRRGKRDEEVPEEEERPRSRRGRAEAEEEEPEERGARADRSERRRSKEPEEDEEKPTRRTRRSSSEEEEDEPTTRRRSSRKEEAEEDESPRRSRSRREEAESEEEEEESPRSRRGRAEADEDESPTKQAKEKLSRLKSRGR